MQAASLRKRREKERRSSLRQLLLRLVRSPLFFFYFCVCVCHTPSRGVPPLFQSNEAMAFRWMSGLINHLYLLSNC